MKIGFSKQAFVFWDETTEVTPTPNTDKEGTYQLSNPWTKDQHPVSHLQYLLDRQEEIANILASEIHVQDYSQRKDRAEVLRLLSRQSSVQGANYMEFNDCQALVVHGEQVLLCQCQKTSVLIKSTKTECGTETTVNHGSLSLDGRSFMSNFLPCLHDGYFAQIHEVTHEWNTTSNEWEPAHQIVPLAHAHLAAKFSMLPDAAALQELALPGVDPNLKNFMDVIGELGAMMDTGEIEPPAGGQLQDKKKELNLPSMDLHFWTNGKQMIISWLITTGVLILNHYYLCLCRPTSCYEMLLWSLQKKIERETRNTSSFSPRGEHSRRTNTCHFSVRHLRLCHQQICLPHTIPSAKPNE